MINIFTYTDIQKYLQDFWDLKRKNSPSFTVRAWSRQMGMSYHTPLYEMIRGKRKVYTNFIPVFIQFLKLTPNEATYFEILVDVQRAKDINEREHYLQKLKEFQPEANELKISISKNLNESFQNDFLDTMKSLEKKYKEVSGEEVTLRIKIEVCLGNISIANN